MCAASLTIIAPVIGLAQNQTLKVINKPAYYKAAVKEDSLQRMVSVRQVAPGLVVDLPYASPINFTRTTLYPATKNAYLRLPAARALAVVQQALGTQGLGLKIWDAYRPYSVTKKMWALIGDERYVAHPAKGSGHNRGIAVDLTIIDLSTGSELDMGTPFDHFTEAAHHDYNGLTQPQQQARTLLKTIMEQHGFRALATEWWHYSWPGAERYGVMDLTHRQLERLAN